MMVQNGASSVTVHLESSFDCGVRQVLAAIRAGGAQAALAIKPGTPAEAVVPYVQDVDFVLVMTVEPGFGGQALIEACLDKVAWLRTRFPSLPVQVDGGVTAETAKRVAASGATMLVAGTAIVGAGDAAQVMSHMRRAVEHHQQQNGQ